MLNKTKLNMTILKRQKYFTRKPTEEKINKRYI